MARNWATRIAVGDGDFNKMLNAHALPQGRRYEYNSAETFEGALRIVEMAYHRQREGMIILLSKPIVWGSKKNQ